MQLKLAQISFLLLLLAISLVYGLMLQPLLTPIVWAALIAILFHPLQMRLQPRFGKHRNLLAATVLLICIIMVILPISAVIAALVREAAIFYDQVHSGEIDMPGFFSNHINLPPAADKFLQTLGINVHGLGQTVKNLAKESSQFITTQALNLGQHTAQFVFTFALLLYLAFFFLRDGEMLTKQIIRGLALGEQREQLLVHRVSKVIAAVVRGGLLVATVQGTLGGLMFWILGIETPLLWGVTMVLASLIPAVGSSLIWAPFAIYLLATGMMWQGIVMLFCGFFVISMIDNILRPILVGRGTGVPDYLILVSTLGGIFLFGINGFVLGPLVIAIFISLWDMFIREYNPPH